MTGRKIKRNDLIRTGGPARRMNVQGLPSGVAGSDLIHPRLPMADLTITARAGRAHVPYLRRYLPKAIGMLPTTPQEISLALVGDGRMAELHERFLGIPGTTDVLTFELDHDARGNVSSGEIVICVPYAVREAKKRTHEARQELLLYAIHGILHLSGYDDRTEADFRRMHRKEDAILSALGVGPIFKVG